MHSKFCFAIDRGGTFTDVYAKCPNDKIRVLKLLSVDPDNYRDAPTEGIKRVLQEELGVSFPPDAKIPTQNLDWIRMGTTVATNALLERKGERTALAITSGFRDLLQIGNQARPNIFDLKVNCPSVLYEDVIEVEERVIPRQDLTDDECRENGWEIVKGTTNEELVIIKKISNEKLREGIRKVLSKGITSLAVVLLHSYTYPVHELIVEELARSEGMKHVSLSSTVMPMIRTVPRGVTACSDAYLTPHIQKYLKGFCSGFEDELKGINVSFMQSDGGLTQMNSFHGSRAILSGPAGGVVGYVKSTYELFGKEPIIGFDMGGTSTDVSRYAGQYEHVFETSTAGVTIQAPQLDINTVAAGGGSCLFFRSGIYVVGPESAGAHPGPVCYQKGGPLAVTDANLVLGRLQADYFPKIFGPKEDQPLDRKKSEEKFEELTKTINNYQKTNLSIEDVASGFVRVANEAMCRPIRAITQSKGYDTSLHILSVFGGAGGQHACAIARSLGITKVVVPKYAGILSAVGMAMADVVHEKQEPCCWEYYKDTYASIAHRFEELTASCIKSLVDDGFEMSSISVEHFLNLRYEGTDCALMCSGQNNSKYKTETALGVDYRKIFLDRYLCEFGFTLENRRIMVDDIRVRGIGASDLGVRQKIEIGTGVPKVDAVCNVYFDGHYHDSNIYLLSELGAGHNVKGPAIIMDNLSTILIEPACDATINEDGHVLIRIGKEERKIIGTHLDSIQLSIFSHRFMSLAEQMGRILQRTSISTNIKERLDFSCALFGPDGGLVSNAPHIPVHLGAMQETVQYQLQTLGSSIIEGDVLLSNHPCAGGSHLPDLTVITPVFRRNVERPVFYVASRGHHADIGGTTPGSMPPHSTSIYEEGAVFYSFKLVEGGVFQESKLRDALMAPGLIPGCSGTRNMKDNLSDLKAQVAANQKGIQLANELIDFYGLDVVQSYMKYIQDTAELSVRNLFEEVGRNAIKRTGEPVLAAKDYMDDGSPINLKVTIDPTERTAIFDFSGTGPEVWGNCNAPRAITVSAVIYCLRCLVGYDIPLNQGCLNPVSLVVPDGCLLSPSKEAAVVGGNVLTSQRVVDVILKAFGACAASQGCMNNVTFGDETMGYYETVAGGAGAGPFWNGRSGIHTHMTNTRITDPEILETRYPVTLETFTLNRGTGGRGKYSGGDGVRRHLCFRRPLDLSILTERRVFAPYGLQGGECGAKGENILVRKSGRVIRLPSKSQVKVEKGDRFLLHTPGGGGYGTAVSNGEVKERLNGDEKSNYSPFEVRGSVADYTRNQESA